MECLKSGGVSITKWLVRLLNVYFVTSVVPVDWASAPVVLFYKGIWAGWLCGSAQLVA